MEGGPTAMGDFGSESFRFNSRWGPQAQEFPGFLHPVPPRGLPIWYSMPAIFWGQKFLKKALARGKSFDSLVAPFRSEGRMVSMVAGR
jgi:hypothetical protein